MIIHLLWNWSLLKINFLPGDPEASLALNWCIFTKDIFHILDFEKLHIMRKNSFAEKLQSTQNDAVFFHPTDLIHQKKIENSWKELDVFYWANHLGTSWEQEEKAWDWRKCADFLTSSVIRKTRFMLPPTSTDWCLCSLQISILLILFVLQALCSRLLMGGESGQISKSENSINTRIIKIVIKIKSIVLFAGQEPHHFFIFSQTYFYYFLLPEMESM